ncbi:flavin reductase family protein [Sphingomonas prati]|uniref:Flavin reductase (DIM6/NTAB) family NADH-FMN oxidoreductase RutF n=1 Tax=Sphingomonas prati TaxID=1843237 RepID=A0A7W9F1T1_9SPHN|nr:flavin reductase family protein [Sphingomonas prati]MBB5729586.1 flavin reductase (DIM6/NTAB) family NADH-FMN oxidoreductase RutF [Sphingomonas prati]GGE76323.1 Asp/Glu/hydantoin racemase [Sphingomonas prati]
MTAGPVGDTHFYEPSAGHRLPHDPFKAIVAPRPIGWISTVDPDGRPNLAPYSYFNAVCDVPPMILFSSNGRKDTLRNAEATGCFVWNLATRPLAERMNETAAPVAPDVDEFFRAGLTATPSRLVPAPRVAESPAALECRVLQVIPLADLDGASADHFMVVGQVVGVHIDPAYLRDGLFDTAAAQPILRAGYRGDYATIKAATMFEMIRPTS